MLEERGDTLISVPCWWDGKNESLIASVRLIRPDLFAEVEVKAEPIPRDPPPGYFKVKTVPGVGELTVPSVNTAASFDPTDWWLSEKYDGIRACWNSFEKALYATHYKTIYRSSLMNKIYSRAGKILEIADEYVAHLPDVLIDGEVWFGRGTMELAQQFGVTPQKIDTMRFLAFDLPFSTSVFEDRYKALAFKIPPEHEFTILVSQSKLQHREQMIKSTAAILQSGGEGIIVRKPKAEYQGGRAENILKYKANRDAEAIVREIDGDECILELPNGSIFRSSIPDNIPRSELKSERVVTFIFSGFNPLTLLPRGARILRLRPDLSRKEIMDNFALPRFMNRVTTKAFTDLTNFSRPYGHWTKEENKNMRIFFDELANSLNFDPLIQENWYRITRHDILSRKSGNAILSHYNGSFAKALVDVYPELQLDPRRFVVMPRYHWYNPTNRKRFLESIAKNAGFDPLIADNWYPVTKDTILNEKSGGTFLNFFGGSLVAAISDAYPKLILDEKMFDFTTAANHWNSAENRRIFFDNYAKNNLFDPLKAENWYSVARTDVLRSKSGGSVLNFYGGSLVKALCELYPDIGLDKRKFNTMSRNFWRDANNRRHFFDQLAKKKGFDPLIPDNWYSLSKATMISEKNGMAVLYYYNESFVDALIDLYPNLGLEKHKFHFMQRNHWSSSANRRGFMDSLAKKFGFEPLVPENWYSVPINAVTDEKNGTSVLYHHGGSFVRAVMELYPDIGLQKDSFSHTPTALWTTKSSRRSFFDKLAQKKNFDPLIPGNWYSRTREFFSNEHSGGSLLNFYGGSFIRALLDLYPDIGLDVYKFANLPKNFWFKPKNRRRFFDTLATKLGFDPLIAENWYAVSKDTILKEKNASMVLQHHEHSFVKALADLYPSVEFQQNKFIYSLRSLRKSIENRRRFFMDTATKHDFDPLTSDGWYKLSKEDILNEAGGAQVLSLYDGNYISAVQQLFPELNLDATKFEFVRNRASWTDERSRRQFFVKYAELKNFNPLLAENWYCRTAKEMAKEPGGHAVLKFYGRSMFKALSTLFPDIGIEEVKFSHPTRNYFAKEDNRKKFYVHIAEKHGFDLRDPQRKKFITKLVSEKGGQALSNYVLKTNSSIAKELNLMFGTSKVVPL